MTVAAASIITTSRLGPSASRAWPEAEALRAVRLRLSTATMTFPSCQHNDSGTRWAIPCSSPVATQTSASFSSFSRASALRCCVDLITRNIRRGAQLTPGFRETFAGMGTAAAFLCPHIRSMLKCGSRGMPPTTRQGSGPVPAGPEGPGRWALVPGVLWPGLFKVLALVGRDLRIKAGCPGLKDRANDPPGTGTTALRNGKEKNERGEQ